MCVVSHGYGGLGGGRDGGGGSPGGLVECREMTENFPSARLRH